MRYVVGYLYVEATIGHGGVSLSGMRIIVICGILRRYEAGFKSLRMKKIKGLLQRFENGHDKDQ